LIDREIIEVLQNNIVSDEQRTKGVCADQRIILGRGTQKSTLRIKVRLITYQDPLSGKLFQFLTNNNHFNASTVADLYKDRWQIELFFKRFKQHNPLRYFLGDNENAIKIQIWCAFITDLLIKIIKDQLKRKWSFANLSALIKHHLMNYLHLIRFLNNPEKDLIDKNSMTIAPELFDS
jgi:IS4 transposase